MNDFNIIINNKEKQKVSLSSLANFIWDEFLTIEENDKKILNFSISSKETDILKYINIGRKISLFFKKEKTDFIISNISFLEGEEKEFDSFVVEAQDFASFVFSRNNVGLTLDTIEDEEYIDWLENNNLKGEVLDLLNYILIRGGLIEKIEDQKDVEWKINTKQGLDILTKKINISLTNSNTYNALVEISFLADAFMFFDYEKKEISFLSKEDSSFNDKIQLSPTFNLNELEYSNSSESLFSILHIEGGEDDYNIVLGLVPKLNNNEWNLLYENFSKQKAFNEHKKMIVDLAKENKLFSELLARNSEIEEDIIKQMDIIPHLDSFLFNFDYFLKKEIISQNEYDEIFNRFYYDLLEINLKFHKNLSEKNIIESEIFDIDVKINNFSEELAAKREEDYSISEEKLDNLFLQKMGRITEFEEVKEIFYSDEKFADTTKSNKDLFANGIFFIEIEQDLFDFLKNNGYTEVNKEWINSSLGPLSAEAKLLYQTNFYGPVKTYYTKEIKNIEAINIEIEQDGYKVSNIILRNQTVNVSLSGEKPQSYKQWRDFPTYKERIFTISPLDFQENNPFSGSNKAQIKTKGTPFIPTVSGILKNTKFLNDGLQEKILINEKFIDNSVYNNNYFKNKFFSKFIKVKEKEITVSSLGNKKIFYEIESSGKKIFEEVEGEELIFGTTESTTLNQKKVIKENVKFQGHGDIPYYFGINYVFYYKGPGLTGTYRKKDSWHELKTFKYQDQEIEVDSVFEYSSNLFYIMGTITSSNSITKTYVFMVGTEVGGTFESPKAVEIDADVTSLTPSYYYDKNIDIIGLDYKIYKGQLIDFPNENSYLSFDWEKNEEETIDLRNHFTTSEEVLRETIITEIRKRMESSDSKYKAYKNLTGETAVIIGEYELSLSRTRYFKVLVRFLENTEKQPLRRIVYGLENNKVFYSNLEASNSNEQKEKHKVNSYVYSSLQYNKVEMYSAGNHIFIITFDQGIHRLHWFYKSFNNEYFYDIIDHNLLSAMVRRGVKVLTEKEWFILFGSRSNEYEMEVGSAKIKEEGGVKKMNFSTYNQPDNEIINGKIIKTVITPTHLGREKFLFIERIFEEKPNETDVLLARYAYFMNYEARNERFVINENKTFPSYISLESSELEGEHKSNIFFIYNYFYIKNNFLEENEYWELDMITNLKQNFGDIPSDSDLGFIFNQSDPVFSEDLKFISFEKQGAFIKYNSRKLDWKEGEEENILSPVQVKIKNIFGSFEKEPWNIFVFDWEYFKKLNLYKGFNYIYELNYKFLREINKLLKEKKDIENNLWLIEEEEEKSYLNSQLSSYKTLIGDINLPLEKNELKNFATFFLYENMEDYLKNRGESFLSLGNSPLHTSHEFIEMKYRKHRMVFENIRNSSIELVNFQNQTGKNLIFTFECRVVKGSLSTFIEGDTYIKEDAFLERKYFFIDQNASPMILTLEPNSIVEFSYIKIIDFDPEEYSDIIDLDKIPNINSQDGKIRAYIEFDLQSKKYSGSDPSSENFSYSTIPGRLTIKQAKFFEHFQNAIREGIFDDIKIPEEKSIYSKFRETEEEKRLFWTKMKQDFGDVLFEGYYTNETESDPIKLLKQSLDNYKYFDKPSEDFSISFLERNDIIGEVDNIRIGDKVSILKKKGSYLDINSQLQTTFIRRELRNPEKIEIEVSPIQRNSSLIEKLLSSIKRK